MKAVTGKQMKTVWRKLGTSEGQGSPPSPPGGRTGSVEERVGERRPFRRILRQCQSEGERHLDSVWTMPAPGNAEKSLGKHPTQKPLALLERCLLAATHESDTVLDPFLGAGTTAVACVRLGRQFVGIELDYAHLALGRNRTDHEIITVWLREIRVSLSIETFLPKDLDPDTRSMDRIRWMKDAEPKTDCIYHETKFVFLSCAAVSSASVVHTTIDVSLQEAWATAPSGKKRETTHIVRCQTEILRVKSN